MVTNSSTGKRGYSSVRFVGWFCGVSGDVSLKNDSSKFSSLENESLILAFNLSNKNHNEECFHGITRFLFKFVLQ